jgi:hypothetical protein
MHLLTWYPLFATCRAVLSRPFVSAVASLTRLLAYASSSTRWLQLAPFPLSHVPHLPRPPNPLLLFPRMPHVSHLSPRLLT